MPPERPPVARIATVPTAILVHDNFQTEVMIDGSKSAVLDDPDAALTYAWQLLDDEARTDGSLRGEMLTVKFRGDTPPRIVLTVTSPDGQVGSVTHRLPLTL